MSLTQGTTTEKFAPVRDVLESQLANGEDVGASVAVYSKGELVVDIWGGFVDEAKTTPWRSDTIVNVWSTTKTMTFLVALMLSDRGMLDFRAPVSRYWPEFAANGKGGLEVRHLMSHTAGLSGFANHIEKEDLANWDLCVESLAAQAPWWDDRGQSGYHAVTQGYLIGEVVRRLTGTTIGQFFKSEVADVVGADFHIGLPESEEPRVSLVIPSSEPSAIESIPEGTVAHRTFTSPALDATMPHNRWWRAAEIPAANGHGNARSVATIQSIVANRGELNGTRFFSEATGDQIFESQSRGVDLCLGVDSHFGMGYGLASSVAPVGPRTCFWGGYGGSVITMDQDLGLTVAYMMNKMEVGLIGDVRGANIGMAAAVAAFS